MTRQLRNTSFALFVALPPTLLALALWLPESYWL
jgi:hypothetical protein